MKPWEKYQEMEVSRSPKETGPWDKYAGSGENRGLIGAALDGLEKYGSAPLRAAYGQVQDSMLKRGIPIDVLGAAKAAYDQFGDDPAKAPTAAQLVEQNPLGSVLNKQGFKQNFSTHPTAVGLRGLMAPFTGWDRSGEIIGEVPRVAAETLVAGETDPLSYVPGAVFEKPIVKGFELGGKALSSTGKLGAYLAENTTGIPREVWSNYAKRAKEIGKMAKDYVGDSRYMNAYTDFRNQVGEAIAGRKNQLNEMIDQGLSGASRGSKISITPIIEELDTSMRGLHPVTEKAAIDEIQALKNKVRELAPEGKMSPWDAYKLQRFFHDRSMKAFAEGGQLFNPSSQAARAAKSARYKTTEMVNQFFPDTIKKANQQFVSLHNIDDMIPPSMLDPNGSAAALRRAALDPNSKERKALTQLSQFLHGDDRLVQQAMDLSTFEKMTNLPINPLSGGGTTSTSRTLLGGGVGLLGEASDDPEAKWLARGAGAMIASPALLKMGLDAGLMAPNAAKRLASKGGLLEKGVEKINPTMRALEKRLEGAGGKAKEFIKDEEGSFSPEDLLNILKPGEENVFDLKKARGLVGEPKRGLLEPKDNPVAKYRPPLSREERADLLNWIDSAYDSLRRGEKFKPVDEQYLREVLPVAPDYQKKYVKDLLATIEKQKVGGAEEVASALGGRPEFPESVSAAQNFKPGQIIKSQNGKTWEVLDASSPDGILKLKNPNGDIVHTPASDVLKFYESTNKSQPRGLLTSLDVERGPVKELPEGGTTSPFLINNRPPVLKPGTKVSLPDGDTGVTIGEYSYLDPERGRVYDVQTPFGRQQIAERELYGEKYKSYFDDKEKSNIAYRESIDRVRDSVKTESAAEKAAEAERMKKGLIGVDFGGRGGKPPKRLSDSDVRSGKYIETTPTLDEGYTTSRKGVGPTSEERSAMNRRRDEETLKNIENQLQSPRLPKTEKQKLMEMRNRVRERLGMTVDVPLGGRVSLKKSTSNSMEGGKTFEVVEALDDEPGYLLYDADTGKTFPVRDSDISQVFNDKGKPVKPKGGKGKPKKKK